MISSQKWQHSDNFVHESACEISGMFLINKELTNMAVEIRLSDENKQAESDKPFVIDKSILLTFVSAAFSHLAATRFPPEEIFALGFDMARVYQTMSDKLFCNTDRCYSLVEGEDPPRRVKIEIGKCELCPFSAYTPGTKEHPSAGLCSVLTKDVDDVNVIPEWCPIFKQLQGE